MRRFLLALCVVCFSSLMTTDLVAAPATEPPATTHFFTLNLEGAPMPIAAVEGIGSENEVIEHRIVTPGGDTIQKIPGRLKYFDLTLKRGVTSNLELWAWRAQVESGNISTARRNCAVIMLDQAGTPVARWNFLNAWPSKISLETEGGLAVEVLTLAVEGVTRVAP